MAGGEGRDVGKRGVGGTRRVSGPIKGDDHWARETLIFASRFLQEQIKGIIIRSSGEEGNVRAVVQAGGGCTNANARS